MKKQRWICAAVLLLVLVISFGVHILSNTLPAIPADQRDFYRDEDGVPYLSEMDSYYYVRLAREMAEADAPFLYSNRTESPLMGQRPVEDAGQGDPLLLSILAYYVWRFLSLFSNVRIIDVARFMGPVLGSLAAVPAFLYVRRRLGLAGAVTAGLLVCLSLPFVAHTHAGFFDTDMLLGILPLGFVLLQLRAMQEKRLSRQIIAGACAGLLLGLCSLTWYAFYTYFWLLVLGGLIGVLLTMIFPLRCPWRRKLLIPRGWLFSVLSALLFVFLFRGKQGMQSLMNVINTFRSVGGSTNVFPFVHQYTGEMQAIPLLPDTGSAGLISYLRADIANGIGCLGGLIPCVLAALAIPLTLWVPPRAEKMPEERREKRIAALTEIAILLLWLGFGVVLMRSRRRFTEIAALPAAILAGLGVGCISSLFRRLKVYWRALAGAVLALGACIPLVIGSAALARSARPDVTDSMSDAMAWVGETQPENAVIASWWDYGYYMQYEARRRAFIDGGTTSGILNYFAANALLSDDPARAAGIFRIMETSSTSPVGVLIQAGLTQSETAKKLMQIAALSRAEAAEELPDSMTEEERTALLDKTHPEDENPILLVLSSDMMAKIDAIAYYGLWDTDTVSRGEGVYWMPGSASQELLPGSEAVFTLLDPSITLTARMDETGFVQVYQQANGEAYHLSRLCVWRDGVRVQDTPLPGNGPATVLIEENGRTALFSCSPNLCDSLLVRLYVCMDRTLDGAQLLGNWEGLSSGDLCPAQRRLNVLNQSFWSTQVWDISGLLR